MTPRQASFEVIFVCGLAAGYVTADMTSVPKRWLIATVLLALGGYAWLILRRGGETLRDFGLRVDNLGEAVKPIAAWTALAAASLVAWAAATGGALWRPELAVLLPVYPLYGVTQQLIFQGVLHRRLMVLISHRGATVALSAVAFGLVHLPNWPLMGLTFVAGGAWSALYQRWPNVWALGVSHGILAALAYPLVLRDNPLVRL